MDLGPCHSDDAAVLENRRRLRAFLPGDPHWLSQVHGAHVVTLDATARAGSCPEADAAVTAVPGIVCAIRTADCLPVIVADTAGACVGVAHAGWRGLAAGVLETTVTAVRALGATAQVAWLGPAIGPAAFEVGSEVRAAFVAHDPRAATAFVAGAPDKWFADLYALARMRLHDAGVAAVRGGGYCTRTDARFFSYRRDRDAGRMAALAWLEG
jgi:YfiH family protein